MTEGLSITLMTDDHKPIKMKVGCLRKPLPTTLVPREDLRRLSLMQENEHKQQ